MCGATIRTTLSVLELWNRSAKLSAFYRRVMIEPSTAETLDAPRPRQALCAISDLQSESQRQG
jgi:hypothetical protein